MRATKTLPPDYHIQGTIDLNKNIGQLIVMNLLALAALILFGWLFIRWMEWLRPGELLPRIFSFRMDSLGDWAMLVVGILLLSVFYITAHEALHGLFFWIFTKSRPLFAFRWAYAYAAAPDWYIQRNAYLVTALAPLVGISLAGLLAAVVVPPGWLLPLWFILVSNASGAVGDIVVAGWLLLQPPACLARDSGDAVTLYVPNAQKSTPPA